MVLRRGERLHLEVLTEEIEDPEGRPPLTRALDPAAVCADVVRRGGVVTDRADLVGQAIDYGYGEEPSKDKRWQSCRLEVEWQ